MIGASPPDQKLGLQGDAVALVGIGGVEVGIGGVESDICCGGASFEAAVWLGGFLGTVTEGHQPGAGDNLSLDFKAVARIRANRRERVARGDGEVRGVPGEAEPDRERGERY